MNIEYLEEFLMILKHERFSDAADELFTTSSSLSKHMRSLEEELGVELFKKVHRNSVPNEYGRLIEPYAKEIVEKKNEMLGRLVEQQKDRRDTLHVISHYRIFEEALLFRKKTGINVIIHEDHNARELLDDGVCEVGIFIKDFDNTNGLEKVPYKKERMIFLCPGTHRLAGKKTVTMQDVKKESFVMFPMSDGNPLSALIFEEFRKCGITPKIAITATVGSTIAKLIAQDAGVGFLWEKALKAIMPEGISVIPYEPFREIEVEIAWERQKTLSANAQKFIDFMKPMKDLEE